MSATCDRIDAYVDGTLSMGDLDAFETHLIGCPRCQQALEDGLQLSAAGAELAARVDRPQVALPVAATRRSRRGWLAGAAALMSAAAIAIVIWRVVLPQNAAPSLEDRVASTLAPRRAQLARLPYEPLDRYRPYDTPRGASVPEPISLQLTAEVEASRDPGALAAVLIARRDLDQAEALLARSGGDSIELSRAAIALMRRDPGQALTHLDGVLARSPTNTVAAWNRALALTDLELPLAAAEMFDVVIKGDEPGWSDEARTRAAELRRATEQHRAHWLESKRVCEDLVAGKIDLEGIRRHVAVCRPYFYEALRVAPTSAARSALVPVAALMDAGTGHHAAAELVDRVNKPLMPTSVAARSPRDHLVATYLRLTRTADLDQAEKLRLLDELRSARADDLMLGAIPRTGLPGLREEYAQRAVATADPYYLELVKEREAEDLLTRGDPLAAEALLVPVTRACALRDIELRCQYLHFALATVYEAMHRPAKSREVVRAALVRSKRLELYWDERQLFDYLAEAARLDLDHSQMRAYLREATLRSGGECAQEQFALESLAEASVEELQFTRARRELAVTPMCNEPASIARISVLAELAHVDGTQLDLDVARVGLTRARNDEISVGERARLDAMEGRMLAARDPGAATALLRRAIAATQNAPRSDVSAGKARADAFASLVVASAGAGDHTATLALFAEATGAPASAACVVGALVDADRVVIVAKKMDGTLLQNFDPHGRRAAAIDASSLVPKSIRVALADCDRIDVLALPPVFGLPGLLPPELAWSYRGRPTRIAAAAIASPKVLAVADPQPPRDLAFAPLDTAALTPIPGATHIDLRGAAATPQRTSASLPLADAIEIHAHGYINVGASESSLIALSPEANGAFTLSAADIAKVPLPKAPLVILAACHAAYTAPYRHESWGLPQAFLFAGARAVLASREAIPDREAAAFFRAVEARILAGTDPAIALRDARVRALTADPKSWAAAVLLFD